jgi:hypothetical protein
MPRPQVFPCDFEELTVEFRVAAFIAATKAVGSCAWYGVVHLELCDIGGRISGEDFFLAFKLCCVADK